MTTAIFLKNISQNSMSKRKIIFLFNQLQTSKIYTGGEIRGKTMFDYYIKSKKFNTYGLIPEITKSNFNNSKLIIIGKNILEKSLSKPTLLSALILHFTRTIETLSIITKLKNSILYTTGDFYCNTLPAYITKFIYPKTIWVSCIHHINLNPFKRKSNYFLASTLSFIFQRFSFMLIKQSNNLIFVSNPQVKNYLKNHRFKNPIYVTGEGLDIKLINKQMNSIKNNINQNSISYFGRLSPTKGILDLPVLLKNILIKYPNIKLNLIGQTDSKFKNKLIDQFQQNNCLNNVIFHGFIEKKTDIYKILKSSKIIVFPSYEEGWGISLFESIMTKRPVIAYNLVIFKHIFKNNLITAPIGNIKVLSQKAIDILDNKFPNKTNKSIINCFKIASKYDWKNVYLTEKNHILNIIKSNYVSG